MAWAKLLIACILVAFCHGGINTKSGSGRPWSHPLLWTYHSLIAFQITAVIPPWRTFLLLSWPPVSGSRPFLSCKSSQGGNLQLCSCCVLSLTEEIVPPVMKEVVVLSSSQDHPWTHLLSIIIIQSPSLLGDIFWESDWSVVDENLVGNRVSSLLSVRFQAQIYYWDNFGHTCRLPMVELG